MSTPTTGSAAAPAGAYAGDVEPAEAWRMLGERPDAVLVDVRTAIELALIGAPDLSSVGHGALHVEWQTQQGRNPNFPAALRAALDARGVTPDTPLLFLCRSGGRSRAAAIDATALGYRAAFNIAHGFEGDLDGQRHRNGRNGWRASGLPWSQT